MTRDLPKFEFEFEKMERFNPEAATGGTLERGTGENVRKKFAKLTEKHLC